MKYPTYLLSTLIACIIFFLCVIQLPDETPPAFQVPYFDKVVHLLMYFGLTGVILLEYFKKRNDYSWKGLCNFIVKKQSKPFKSILPRTFVIMAFLPLLYGGLIELIQENFIHNRTGDIYDFFADAGGILIAVLITVYILKVKEKKITIYL